jgi:hypothetical protein
MGSPTMASSTLDGAGPVGAGVGVGVGAGSTTTGVDDGARGGDVGVGVTGGGAVDAQPAITASERTHVSFFNGSVPLRGWRGVRPGSLGRAVRSGDTSPTTSI